MTSEQAQAEWLDRAIEIEDELQANLAAIKAANEAVAKVQQTLASLRVRRQRIEQERTDHARRKPLDPNTVIDKPSYDTEVIGEYPRYSQPEGGH